MKRVHFTALLLSALVWSGCAAVQPARSDQAATDSGLLEKAFKAQQSDVQVEGEGVVTRILADDLAGGRHQRFIVLLASGQTILISHNIDLAPRVERLQEGDRVRFNGEYVWNQQGGTVHWTHHDPNGRHVAGWIKHEGQIYH